MVIPGYGYAVITPDPVSRQARRMYGSELTLSESAADSWLISH